MIIVWLNVCSQGLVTAALFWGPVQSCWGSGWRWQESESLWENNTNQQRLPVSRRDTQWAAWRHRNRGHTAVQWERDQAHPFDIHKRTYLHNTDRFWSHRPLQIHQNPSLLLTRHTYKLLWMLHLLYHASDHMTDLANKLMRHVSAFALSVWSCDQRDFHIKLEIWYSCLSVME